MAKRLFDIVVSLVCLLLVSPIMLVAAIMIRSDSPGPIIYKQKRVGKDGKVFYILKFRTMIESAETVGAKITSRNDPRVTQVGGLLRWLKIDELPQFINVFKGEMSIVGPRPEVPEIVGTYTLEERKILKVQPGLMGPNQITNRDEESMIPEEGDVEEFYIKKILPKKIEADLAYVRNKDIFKDWKFLFGGVATLLLSSIKFRYILESRRRFAFLIADLIISTGSFYVAFALRFEGDIPPADMMILKTLIPFVFLLRAPCFIYFGLYQSLWQYLGIQELISIIKAVSVGTLLLPLVPFLLQIIPIPRSIVIIDWFMLIMALGGLRIVFKVTAEKLRKPRFDLRKRVLIVGAEDPGEFLVREYIRRPDLGYWPIGFVDNDPQKIGVRIHGVKVIGTITQLAQVIRVTKTDEVIIALPEASGDEIRNIIKVCRSLDIICRILPHASPLMSPQVLPLRLRNIEVSDLLGRELVQADLTGIQNFLKNKRILVTGAGGSIGSELSKIIHQNFPQELILIDNSENNLYEIETDLQNKASETSVAAYLRSVTNYDEMQKIFSRHKPHVIYHAAAFKHVPLMEIHYMEGVFNNILGSKIMADLALEHGAESFVLISSDKAIRPRSIMGATKRIAELYTQSLKNSGTRFMAVRFGNVFNSKGSVVPLFRKQIEQGGPITITDPNVKRYFMEISEAVFLILQATAMGSKSEIFILDMGEPVKIVDLAKDLVQLMGLPREAVPIRYIGLRPGEKLNEEIEMHSEEAMPTSHKKIKIWKSIQDPPSDINEQIMSLVASVRQGAGRDDVIEKIKTMVPEYMPWYFPA
ncbi:MAG: polysaccharide biosynthesis protein [Candidatus Omnitrophica bacterium]|nr:polysaccharide biosynthesis protein [Candidatus Omnitrophota bacterium]